MINMFVPAYDPVEIFHTKGPNFHARRGIAVTFPETMVPREFYTIQQGITI